jgi:GNAT superfamily N-acetyltransferase
VSVELRTATDAEKRARDELTFAVWGNKLTVPQYLDREKALRKHPWSREAMTTWFLTDGSDVLCSCETFRNDSTINGKLGSSFAVASVFTEPEKRGQGHAAKLMSALLDRLRERPDAQSSILFSDVGTPIYEQSGYRAWPAFDWVLPPGDFPLEAQWLPQPVPAPPARSGGEGQLVLHPSAAQLDWHLERSRLYARLLARPALTHYGARTPQATAWWTAQFKSDELLVLWLDAPDAAAAAPVLRAAQLQAHQAGLPRVRVWETFSLEGIEGAQKRPRDGELPMAAALNATFSGWQRIERALWV